MKKNLFGMLAAAMLLATSCSEALDDALSAGKMATVSVDLGIPTMQTRAAYSDGTTAQKLQYAVYEVTDNGLVKTKLGGTDNEFNLKKQIEFKLVTGRTYAFVFWAGNENAPYAVDFTATGATMTVDYTKVMANNEHLDAFYKYQEVKVTGDESVQIELRRPFAQINVGTNDYEDAANANYVPAWSHITVSNAYKTLDLVSGAVSDPVEQDVEFTYNVLPNGETFPVAGYDYMAMAYVLVPAEKEVLNTVSFDCSTEYENGEVRAQHNVGSVPVQRNYRTNIYGQLLTSNTEVNVIIEPAYYEPDYNVNPVANGVEYDNETETFYISTAEGLKWVATQVNNYGVSPYVQTSDYKGNYGAENVSFTGQTVVLKNDIDMKGILWTPIGNETKENGASLYAFNGTFDGNGHIIRNLTVREDQNNNAGLFGTTNRATIKNLTLVNVDIMGHYKAGAIVGDGWNVTIENCHVKGGAITSTPWDAKGNGVYDDANNVGGIVGYFIGQPEVSSIKGCTVSDLTITAFRKVGGIAGVAAHRDDHNPHISGLEISGCTVSNTKVIADMTQTRYDGFATRVADIGKIYGYKEGDEDRMTITGNTAGDDVTLDIKKGIDLSEVLAGGSYTIGESGTYSFSGDLSGTHVITINPGLEVIIDGSGLTSAAQARTTRAGEDKAPFHLIFESLNGRFTDAPADITTVTEQKGEYTFTNFSEGVLSVKAANTKINVVRNKLDALDIAGGNLTLNVSNNEIDAKGVTHERYDRGNNENCAYIYVVKYALTFDNNVLTNADGGTISINGWGLNGDNWHADDLLGLNVITSLSGNKFVVTEKKADDNSATAAITFLGDCTYYWGDGDNCTDAANEFMTKASASNQFYIGGEATAAFKYKYTKLDSWESIRKEQYRDKE